MNITALLAKSCAICLDNVAVTCEGPEHADTVPGSLPRNLVGNFLRREVLAPYGTGQTTAAHGA